MDQLVAVLERIAVALERQADADPIIALGAALGQDAPVSPGPLGPPAPPFAATPIVKLYQHPAEGWEIRTYRDAMQPSGWHVVEFRLDG